MSRTSLLFIQLSLFLHIWVGAQQLDTVEEQVDPLKEFQRIETANEKFDFFQTLENPYIESSAYDWLETINVYLDSAKKTSDSSQVDLYQILQARLYTDLGDYSKSLTLMREFGIDKDQLPDDQHLMYLNVLDDNFSGLKMYDRQIEIRKEKRESGFTEGITFHDIYANMGMYRHAMNEYVQDVSGTIAEDDYLERANYHNIRGNYLRLDKSLPTAISEFNTAKNFLGIYMNDVSIEKSKASILKSEMLDAIIDGNIGKTMVEMGDYIESIPFLNGSIESLRELAPKLHNDAIIDNTLALAKAHLELNNVRTAKRLLDTEFEAIDVKQQLLRNRLYGNYHNKMENFQEAAAYYRQNDRLADSLKKSDNFLLKQQLVQIVGESDIENRLFLANAQKQDIEKMREQIEDNREQKNLIVISLIFTLLGFGGLIYAYLRSIKNQKLIERQKFIIEDQLKEKESLLREIHHRVKNNLQMVSSLLSLQTKNTKSKAAIVALEEGKSRVKAMALIHQKLYQNEDLSYIEMQGYIESLINSVQSVYKKGGHNITITIDAEGTELDIDRAIPFGLILNELVSNSFKYAFPDNDENGQIYIHLRKNGEQGFFEYTDNGIGLPEEIDERNHSSMGIRLINRLVNQLQSKLNVDREVEGVRFWFSFT